MKFIDKGDKVQVEIARLKPGGIPQVISDFEIMKSEFEEFLDHVVIECKKAYQREELFPSIKKGG